MFRSLGLFLALTLICGCSTIQRWSLRIAAPVLNEGTNDFSSESDWDFFRESAPANLKRIELLSYQDHKNLLLKKSLIKGYVGIAYGVHETLAMEEFLSGSDSDYHEQQAILLYTRALDYGVDYLSQKGISKDDILLKDEQHLKDLLERRIRPEDYLAVLYFAQSWASLINLQKKNLSLVSQRPKTKILFDWVCDKQPQIESGICDIFFAYHGPAQKSEEIYHQMIQKFPRHLLIRLMIIQDLYLPEKNMIKFEKEESLLTLEFLKWNDSLRSRPNLVNESDYRGSEPLNLFNAIAKKRFEIIQKYKTKVF